MIRAEQTGPETVELHADGAPGVLVCTLNGATGEWEPAEFRLHDGGTLKPDQLPACFDLNDEARDAIEQVAGS